MEIPEFTLSLLVLQSPTSFSFEHAVQTSRMKANVQFATLLNEEEVSTGLACSLLLPYSHNVELRS